MADHAGNGREKRDAVYMKRSEDALMIKKRFGTFKTFFELAQPVLGGNVVSSNRMTMLLNGYPSTEKEIRAMESAIRLYVHQPMKVARELLEDVQKNGACVRPLRPDEVMAIARALLPLDEVSG